MGMIVQGREDERVMILIEYLEGNTGLPDIPELDHGVVGGHKMILFVGVVVDGEHGLRPMPSHKRVLLSALAYTYLLRFLSRIIIFWSSLHRVTYSWMGSIAQ